MHAFNEGAHGGTAPAVGLNILLPFEESANPFQDVSVDFRYFFTRKMKVMLGGADAAGHSVMALIHSKAEGTTKAEKAA